MKTRKTTKVKKNYRRWTKEEDEQLMSLWGERRLGDHAQKRRIAKGLGRTEASCVQRFNRLKKQGKNIQEEFDDSISVLEFLESHKRTLAKEREQRLVIQDTIDKMEVLLGRLKKVIE